MNRVVCAAALSFLLAHAAAAAADLPRKAQLGVAFGPPAAGQTLPGAKVQTVLPASTAQTMGVKDGDVIVEAGGKPTPAVADVLAYAGDLTAGAPVRLIVERDGQRLPLSGTAIGRPRETYAGTKTTYGSVAWRGGQLADLMVTPDGVKDAPVVFLIQGFSCVSVESPSPDAAYRPLVAALAQAGIATYRVEKPGLGDSVGPVKCADIDYAAELDAFRAAYRHLTEDLKVPADRLFIFGHSLGGLEAPMLAAEKAPRGVAVYGTVVRNWADYHHDIDAFQAYLMRGEDPVAGLARSEARREVFRRYYFDKQSPRDIAAAGPNLAQGLREALDWDGGDRAMGRHYKYMQDLAGLPLVPAWRDARTNVLALYGASDMVALNDEDHRLIANLANYYRPGTGTFVEVADTGHGMELIGSREAVQQRARAGGPEAPAKFNPKVAEALAAWIKACLAKPPVG